MTPHPPIPQSFTARKTTILNSLSAPSSTYTDLSPKGTVDDAIKDLINRINTLEGIVTTSSCAGRVSVFLEGRKDRTGKETKGEDVEVRDEERVQEGQAAVPGGKGLGGRWLFVSHDTVTVVEPDVFALLGLHRHAESFSYSNGTDLCNVRIARFQFEPMILHIMAASLHHAQPILTAAINAGFRESGIQSLKNLDDANAFPMIAVRSSGLALESIVGICTDHEVNSGESVDSIVGEDYLKMLIKLANDRFDTNRERVKRFENDLFKSEAAQDTEWEDSEERKERKRNEGMQTQMALREKADAQARSDIVPTESDSSEQYDNGMLDGSFIISR